MRLRLSYLLFSFAVLLSFLEFPVEEERCESIEQLFRAFPVLPVDYHSRFCLVVAFQESLEETISRLASSTRRF